MSFWSQFLPPENISTNGDKIDWLFNYVTIVDLVFFLLVCAGLFGFSYFYSAKRHKKPLYTYGTKKVHIVATLVIAIIVFLSLDVSITKMSNDSLVNDFWSFPDTKNPEVLRVEVLAQQWAWNYRLAGDDGIFNTVDDIVTFNDLRLPANTKIVFHITSKDVLHSFFIANARVKVDAIPGRVTRLWTEIKKPGKYLIACAEMCGTYHYKMKSEMTVYSKAEFEQWKREAKKIALVANDEENPDVFWGWKWEIE